MSAAANSFENTVLDTLGSNASTLHLYTSNPGDDDSGTECSDSSYSSQSISFSSASGGSVSMSAGDVIKFAASAITVTCD